MSDCPHPSLLPPASQVTDITASLAPAGRSNTLAYAGLFNGSDPRPDQSGGVIMMQANLALWTA